MTLTKKQKQKQKQKQTKKHWYIPYYLTQSSMGARAPNLRDSVSLHQYQRSRIQTLQETTGERPELMMWLSQDNKPIQEQNR